MRIDKIIPEKTAVLVIDMQNDFVGPGAPILIWGIRWRRL